MIFGRVPNSRHIKQVNSALLIHETTGIQHVVMSKDDVQTILQKDPDTWFRLELNPKDPMSLPGPDYGDNNLPTDSVRLDGLNGTRRKAILIVKHTTNASQNINPP